MTDDSRNMIGLIGIESAIKFRSNVISIASFRLIVESYVARYSEFLMSSIVYFEELCFKRGVEIAQETKEELSSKFVYRITIEDL